MKKGDLVVVHDWSYHLPCKDSLQNYNHIDYISVDFCPPRFSRLFKIIKLGEFPVDDPLYRYGLKKHPEKNDIIIENIETKQTFFTQKRFVSIPILFRKYN